MLSFCPFCLNILFLKETENLNLAFTCDTCPVNFPVAKNVFIRNYYQLKEIDDVLSNESWKTAESTKITCPKCANDQAYFTQLQTRSADEPMTIFYKCSNQECAHNWRD